ncbi:hypothetical protein LCGC14_1830030 [marine sediment metagenome]|uniref:Uncharacterized protein n=1 Tax=marine sediment metagenome TaxID=412755 RepID=A0A0F9JFY9_9ZZZZ
MSDLSERCDNCARPIQMVRGAVRRKLPVDEKEK